MNVAAREKLYRKFKGGEMTALGDLLESERDGLYDYLLRMTGQISRSMDTIDEVFQSLNEDTLDTIDTYPELKVCLYTTARKFNADIWNAETSRLLNVALEGTAGVPVGAPAEMRERQVLAAVDRQLRSLPGREREAVVLAARGAFSVGETSEIMGIGEHEVEALLGQGLRRITGDGGIAADGGHKAVARLPGHSQPPRSSEATVNLSMVMQGIKTRPVGLWSPRRIVLLALIVLAAALGIAQPDLYRRAWQSLRGESGEGTPAERSMPRPGPAPSNVPAP